MRDYKRRFILSNLIMVGILLVIMNTVIFVYSYNAGREELKTTMEQKIEPYGTIMNILRDRPAPPGSETDARNEAAPPQRDDGGKRPPALSVLEERNEGKYAKNVYVFFYNAEEKKVSVISENAIEDKSELSEIAEKINSEDESFGVLKTDDLYYYKQPGGREIKIAVADRDFLRLENIKLLSALILIFAFSMLGVYFISLKLADRAVGPLEKSIAREKQFVTDASHDLKTPLTVILSGADILSANSESTVSDMEKWVSSIKTSAENMRGLIDEMLALSKSEAESGDECTADFSDIAEKCALFMESAAYEKGIAYTYDIEKGINVRAGGEDVRRIASELITNALKYEEKGGSVKMRLYSDRKKAHFTVTNKKTLIAPEDMAHIFERFYRSDKSRSDKSGHGLGLAIVKNLVTLRGGTIGAESSKNGGTVFSVSLPLKS